MTEFSSTTVSPSHQKDLSKDRQKVTKEKEIKQAEQLEARADFLDKLYVVQFTAGVNTRYHHFYAGRYRWCESFFQIVTGISAVLSCIFSFSSGEFFGFKAVVLSQYFTAGTAILAVLLSVWPFSAWHQSHCDLFRRWTDLLEDSETFEISLPAKITTRDIDFLKVLNGKIYRIGSSESPPNRKKLEEFEAEERKSRGTEQPN